MDWSARLGVQVQDGDQFAVWASFVEIYNEKVCLEAGKIPGKSMETFTSHYP